MKLLDPWYPQTPRESILNISAISALSVDCRFFGERYKIDLCLSYKLSIFERNLCSLYFSYHCHVKRNWISLSQRFKLFRERLIY